MAKTLLLVRKDIAFPKAVVLGKEHKELYEEADKKTAEKFGKDSLVYKTITNGISIKNVTGSQFFWNTNLNQYLPINQRLTQLSDWEEINDLDEDFLSDFYTDSAQIVLRTRIPSWEQNKYLLESLIKQVKGFDFSPKNPLLITNPELVKDDNSKNKYGLLLKIGDGTEIKNDKRFAHSNDGKRVSFGEKDKIVYTKENGVSRVYLDWDDSLDSRNDDLADSSDDGRVVLRDAGGVAPKKLENALAGIRAESTRQIEEIKARTKIAENYLRTGKFK